MVLNPEDKGSSGVLCLADFFSSVSQMGSSSVLWMAKCSMILEKGFLKSSFDG